MSDPRDPGPAPGADARPDPRSTAEPDGALSPGAEISPDTHVGSRFEQVPPGVSAKAGEARPEALIEGNRVARAEDME